MTRLPYHGYIEKAKVALALAPTETVAALTELLDEKLIEENESEFLLTRAGWEWYVNIMNYCMPICKRKLLNGFLIHKLSQKGREITKSK